MRGELGRLGAHATDAGRAGARSRAAGRPATASASPSSAASISTATTPSRTLGRAEPPGRLGQPGQRAASAAAGRSTTNVIGSVPRSPERPRPPAQLARADVAGQHGLDEIAGQPPLGLGHARVREPGEDRLGDGDERHLVGDLEEREAEPVGRRAPPRPAPRRSPNPSPRPRPGSPAAASRST